MSRKGQDSSMFQFFTEIGIIEQLSRAKLERALPDDLKVSQFAVLNHLVRLPGSWSPVRLANAFQVTKAAMTNTLQRLDSLGLVKIISDPNDGRGKLVSLSSAGRDMREKCIRNLSPLLAEMEKELSKQKFLIALPFLEEVRKYLDEHR
ncbi:MAG: DNA-binding MarR family transcriptional regulator [Gammaproteobacteria bacterium]|jgi:DNA-binding MarR family transcriptional regulator